MPVPYSKHFYFHSFLPVERQKSYLGNFISLEFLLIILNEEDFIGEYCRALHTSRCVVRCDNGISLHWSIQLDCQPWDYWCSGNSPFNFITSNINKLKIDGDIRCFSAIWNGGYWLCNDIGGMLAATQTVVCLCPNVKMSDFEVLIGSSTDDLKRICVLWMRVK